MKDFDSKSVKVLPGKILVRTEQVEAKTASGIFLPGSSINSRQQGEVVAVGDNVSKSVVVGAKVNWGAYSGVKLLDENQKENVIVNETDILSVV